MHFTCTAAFVSFYQRLRLSLSAQVVYCASSTSPTSVWERSSRYRPHSLPWAAAIYPQPHVQSNHRTHSSAQHSRVLTIPVLCLPRLLSLPVGIMRVRSFWRRCYSAHRSRCWHHWQWKVSNMLERSTRNESLLVLVGKGQSLSV